MKGKILTYVILSAMSVVTAQAAETSLIQFMYMPTRIKNSYRLHLGAM